MAIIKGSRLAIVAATSVFAATVISAGFMTPAVAASTNLFAKIDASGALVAGNGVSSATQVGTGQYEVTFNRNVSSCAYVATPENAHSQAVQVFTAGGHASANGVYVETKNQGGGLTSSPFDLVVDCGSATSPYAVVGYSANLVRSSAGVSFASLGSGRYTVTFPIKVASCAAIATVGDPGNALVFSPSGVYTGESSANTIYIETKNPGGGLQSGVPFHLALMCPQTPNVLAALVSKTGIMTRGSANIATFEGATGQYTLVARGGVNACATVVTRGSLNTSVPFTPSTVEWVPGPATNTVDIQVRQLLFFGGAFDAQSFHAAVVC